ncbi:MAG: glycosyl hydrolase [Bacillota bacterium]|nr:MAG: glycosyl hydrolase [Bacillota bacterium]
MIQDKKEKVGLLDGLDVWHTKPVLGLPKVLMTDGPHGLRKQLDVKDHLGKKGSVPSTCFPTASLLACSFDRQLLKEVGQGIAYEAKAHQVHMVLGPGINIKRSPLCGRNFEYFSEDPYLTGELAASYVRGVEDEGIGTSVKHFFCNNQEKNRFFIDSIVDERTMHEIYLSAFKRVVKENPASIMASYNKINGFYGTESPIINDVLRNTWGFKGIVVSDWGAISNRVSSLKAGCDLEMPSSMGYHEKELMIASEEDPILEQAIESSFDRMSSFAKTYGKNKHDSYDIDSHHRLAIKAAAESMVLLKNEDVLPLKLREKVLIVTGFDENIRYQGGGSSHINPTKLDNIKDIYQQYSSQIKLTKGFRIDQDSDDQALIDEALLQAVKADKVVLILGLTDAMETEGFDRTHLNLPRNQINLLQRVTQIHPEVIVVVLGGSVVNLNFEPHIKGLIQAYLGGQGAATAIFDILYGKTNPSGRLAETWIDDINQCNVTLTNDNHAVYYDESIYVGYRYYSSYNKPVHFPFGYGLSYSKITYQDFKIIDNKDSFIVSMKLKNEGPYQAKEVIQVYIENNVSSLHKAKRELKAFDKMHLEINEEREISITLPKTAFEVYDTETKSFVIEKGLYKIQVAKHVNEILYEEAFEIDGVELIYLQTSYQKESYDTSDFERLYKQALPPRNIKKKRPYTTNSTLEDLSQTFIGRKIAKMILKEGQKAMADVTDPWMVEVAKKTLLETPLRMLALFSDGSVSFNMLEGIIDLANLKILKGIKKLMKDKKDKKHE